MGAAPRLAAWCVLVAFARPAGGAGLRAFAGEAGGAAAMEEAAALLDDVPFPDAAENLTQDVVAALATQRNVSTMSWWQLVRALFIEEGSTCLLTGGGVVPYFNSCVGCSLTAAHQCVEDMRKNVSFNVPVGCHMDSLGSMTGAYNRIKKIENRRCCPRLENVENEFTWAYRDALRCLVNIYCDDSDVYTDLHNECEAVCPTTNGSIWNLACTPSERSAAPATRPAAATAAVAIAALAIPWLR